MNEKETMKTCEEKKYRILLLTNRDSDNLGDQVIEATDISLLKAVMNNLDISNENFEVISRAAGIVSKKYMATKEPAQLTPAVKAIENCDIVVFGGAPLFNYKYQMFYERTAVTLELAEKYGKPVLFSAIGVEGYDEDNDKCQRLKKTLNFDCVKQITTRDDFESLKRFKASDKVVIDKVSDPAVFTAEVFDDFITEKKSQQKKKIGIFILRANGFKDNGVNFSKEDAAKFWLELIEQLKNEGYEYELLTSGHFGDEAFLDLLVRKYGVDSRKCVFNMNTPEKLIRKISSYDAVVSTRLHPSIISFSLGVPAVGLIWNSKVKQFYKSIGHEERGIEIIGLHPSTLVESIGKAIEEGVEKNEEYLMSVYESLFAGMKTIICPEETEIKSYEYKELKEKLPRYMGTSEAEKEEKLERKFRRTYEKYNTISENNHELKKILKSPKSVYGLAKELVRLIWKKIIAKIKRICKKIKNKLFG